MELNLESIYKSKTFVTALFVVGMFSIVAFTFLIPTSTKSNDLSFSSHTDNAQVLGAIDSTEIMPPDTTEYIYVQISGAVVNPQVAKLPKGSRVFDLIEVCKGFTDDVSNAYVNKILNLARVLTDGEKIYIPFSLEELEPDFASRYVQDLTSTIVNINTASKQQLTTLPQVGDSTADKIIDYRTKNGGFNSIEDIKNVSGIGDKTFEDLKDLISI